MNVNVLKSKMALHGETVKCLAEHLGIAYQTCSRKVNGAVDFNQTEISKIKHRYGLTDEEFAQIFAKDVKI